MQVGQFGPCSFCTNDKLVDEAGNPNEVYKWEFQNTLNQCTYDIPDRAIRWSDGRLVRLEIANDVTEQKNIEKTLKSQHDFTENLIKSSAVATFVIDTNHKILLWNKA